MNTTTARFEFRLFGQCFDEQERLLRARAPVGTITETTRPNSSASRPPPTGTSGSVTGGWNSSDWWTGWLEHWLSAGQWVFPVMAERALRLLPDVACNPAEVLKHRFRFDPASCRAEPDQLLVNGAAIQSIATEGTVPRAVHHLQADLPIGDGEDLSFPRTLARIMGLNPWPHRYGHG